MAECDNDFDKFSLIEFDNALASMKMGKASGLEGSTTEIIKHFSHNTNSLILDLFNESSKTNKIPNGWKKARVVDLLKPGEDSISKKSFRPFSLPYILYRLYERMVMARMVSTVEEQLTPDQAGFGPGRSTCGQLLNLTQYIEDGFEENRSQEQSLLT